MVKQMERARVLEQAGQGAMGALTREMAGTLRELMNI